MESNLTFAFFLGRILDVVISQQIRQSFLSACHCSTYCYRSHGYRFSCRASPKALTVLVGSSRPLPLNSASNSPSSTRVRPTVLRFRSLLLVCTTSACIKLSKITNLPVSVRVLVMQCYVFKRTPLIRACDGPRNIMLLPKNMEKPHETSPSHLNILCCFHPPTAPKRCWPERR